NISETGWFAPSAAMNPNRLTASRSPSRRRPRLFAAPRAPGAGCGSRVAAARAPRAPRWSAPRAGRHRSAPGAPSCAAPAPSSPGRPRRPGSSGPSCAPTRPPHAETPADTEDVYVALELPSFRAMPGPKRFTVCHNPVEAERDHAERDAQLARIEAELERIDALREREHRKRTKTAGAAQQTKRTKTLARSADKAHVKAECALRDHPTLGRYVRLTATGRLRVDRAKLAAEARLDGKFL